MGGTLSSLAGSAPGTRYSKSRLLSGEEDLSPAWHSQPYITPAGHRGGIQGAGKELRRGRGSQHERREQVSTRVTEIQAETRASKGKCICDVAGV